ncbi:ester cyclase [Streptomyces sp. NPDC002701]|uniref:ester cyclase n=1 Tax=Streptomyces sp. NPDC002701 TaxID=3364661 RepID=UPI00368854DE
MSTQNRPGASAVSGSGSGIRPDAGITDVVRAFYEPFRTGDTAIYGEILADNWVDIPLAPGQEQGRAGMAAQIALFRRAMPDYSVEHEDLVVGDDRVAVRNTVSGTHQGAFMGHEPTGRRIEMRTMDIHQVRDNRIVTTWHLEDFAGLMAQLTAPAGATVRAAWSQGVFLDQV